MKFSVDAILQHGRPKRGTSEEKGITDEKTGSEESSQLAGPEQIKDEKNDENLHATPASLEDGSGAETEVSRIITGIPLGLLFTGLLLGVFIVSAAGQILEIVDI